MREVDVATGAQRTLEEALDEGLPSYTCESFGYPTAGAPIGRMEGVQAFLYKPREPRLPVLVEFHGGPDTLQPPFWSSGHALAARDYAVVVPSYRGSAGFGLTFEQPDDRLARADQLQDVVALMEWIKGQPDLDPERVVLMGSSWGGYMVLASMARYPELFRAGICICPAVLDPEPGELPPLIRGWRRAEIGDLSDPAQRAVIEAVSPVTNAGRIRGPVLIVQGAQDARIPVRSVRKLKDAIAASGGQVSCIEAANQGHAQGPSGLREALFLYGACASLLDRARGDG